jgi:hypothetical protein
MKPRDIGLWHISDNRRQVGNNRFPFGDLPEGKADDYFVVETDRTQRRSSELFAKMLAAKICADDKAVTHLPTGAQSPTVGRVGGWLRKRAWWRCYP